MKVTVNGKKTRVTDDMRENAEKKMAKFDKFFNDDATAVVSYFHTKHTEGVEFTVKDRGTVYRCEVEADSYRNAVDRAEDRLEGLIRKNKTRLEKRLRAGAFDSYPMDEPYEEEPEFRIRTKEFSVKPMSTEEAILQMNLSEHNFFVFVDEATGQTNVVYKRKNNEYGLLLPLVDDVR